MKKQLAKPTKTARGFALVQFRDIYGITCSLQASSLAKNATPGTSAIWFGPDDAQPKILASLAAAHGVETTETSGWVPYPIPEEVQLTTRAHLDRRQVKALIEHLQRWLITGKF